MENQNNKTIKSKERSVAYPALTLENSINLVSKLRSGLGKGPYSREDAIKALGYSGVSGTSARAIASLVHYGLLDRNGNTYSQSNLSEEILYTTDETGNARKQAIAKAASSPKLFEKIIEKFSNQSLPSLLENILVKEGVSSNSAKEVGLILKETFTFSGILVNGVVVSLPKKILEDNQKDIVFEKSSNTINDISDFQSNKNILPQNFYTHNESGNNWGLIIKTGIPLNSEIKLKLISITDLLEKINKKD